MCSAQNTKPPMRSAVFLPKVRHECATALSRGLKALLYAIHGRVPGTGVRALEYHYIDDTGSPLSVSAAEFRHHLEILRDDQWRTLTAAEYLNRVSGQPLDAKEVFITFDDGHESFVKLAAPLLLEFGFNATVFVVTDLVGKTASWFDRDRQRIGRLLESFAFDRKERNAIALHSREFAGAKLSGLDELIAVKNQGFGIESHSSTHRFLTELSPQELEDDLQGSREWLKDNLGVESRLLCYPYGDHNDRVESAAAAAGFEVGMLSEFTPGIANTLAVGRLPLGGSVGTFGLRFGLSRAADVLAGIKAKKKLESRAKFVANARDLAITADVKPQ